MVEVEIIGGGVFVDVLVSLSSSTSIPAVGWSCGPSLCFLGTGLIVYHLFLSLTAMNTYRQSSSM